MTNNRLIRAFCIAFAICFSSTASATKTIKLSSGHEMPIIGLGTWQVPAEAIDLAVTSALASGYKHIDTAFTYGNEEAIGKALKKWFANGGKREDLFVTSKLPPYGMRGDEVEGFLKLSLEHLGLQYVDLYLLHKPFGFVKDPQKFAPAHQPDGSVALDLGTNHTEIWAAMERQVRAGRARSIGLSNFNATQLVHVYEGARDVKPSSLQVELQAYNQQRELRALCAARGIAVTAFSTLGSPGSSSDKRTAGSLSRPRLLEHPVVKGIAAQHNRTAAQVLLRHAIQAGLVVLPKSTNPGRIAENIDVFGFSLTDEDVRAMDALDLGEQGRIFHFLIDKGVEKHPEYPFASQIKSENGLE